MKFIAIVGTNATKSYNRKLLQFMRSHFANEAQIEVAEIRDIPLFCEDYAQTPQSVLDLSAQIQAADGVIFGTPEYDHDIPAALKSVIEWLSWKVHPLSKKPVMIVGASLGNLGTVQAQESLRRILDSPGLGSFVLPGFQFLLGRAEAAFDDKGNLIDQGTVSWLEQCFNGFVNYATALEELQQAAKRQPETKKTPTSNSNTRNKEQEAKSAFKALDAIDTTTGASETEDDLSFEEANGITFVMEDEQDLPDTTTSASTKNEAPQTKPEPPEMIYTEDALTSASVTKEKNTIPPTTTPQATQVDTTTGASEN